MFRIAQIMRHVCIMTGIMVILVSCRGDRTRHAQETQDQSNTEIDILDQRILADSLDPDAYYERAVYYLERKEVNQALGDINNAIQLNGENASYFVVLSDIYLALNKIPSCLEALQKAEGLDPGNNDALLKLAELYLILQDYPNVFSYTAKAIEKESNNPVAFFIRGYTLMEMGDTTEAIRNYMAAIDLDQSYFNALMQLGLIYSVQNNPLARDYLVRAADAEPNRTEAYYLLGLSYQNDGLSAEAIMAYDKLLAIDPDYKQAYYNLGYIHLVYLNDYQAAADYFSQAITRDPKYVEAFFNRGYCYELSGQLDLAGQDYRQALKIQPNYERAVEGLNRLDEAMLDAE